MPGDPWSQCQHHHDFHHHHHHFHHHFTDIHFSSYHALSKCFFLLVPSISVSKKLAEFQFSPPFSIQWFTEVEICVLQVYNNAIWHRKVFLSCFFLPITAAMDLKLLQLQLTRVPTNAFRNLEVLGQSIVTTVIKSRTDAQLTRVPTSACGTQKYLGEVSNSCITPQEQYKVPASPSHNVQKHCNFCPQPHSCIYTHTMDSSPQPFHEIHYKFHVS